MQMLNGRHWTLRELLIIFFHLRSTITINKTCQEFLFSLLLSLYKQLQDKYKLFLMLRPFRLMQKCLHF